MRISTDRVIREHGKRADRPPLLVLVLEIATMGSLDFDVELIDRRVAFAG